MGFAERMGLRATRSLVQRDSLDDETRTELWNITTTLVQELARKEWNDIDTFSNTTSAIWAWEFKKARDEQPNDNTVWGVVKTAILKSDWVDALDLLEAIVGYVKRYEKWQTSELLSACVDAYNKAFEIYLVGFRFIGLKLVPIDSETELDALKTARDDVAKFKGARHHLEHAADLLSDRKAPDYPNSIKESISAVESVCNAVTGEHTLGAALKKLKAAGVRIHPALEGAWSKMYGWTSDADGIRHGSIDAPDADQALAKYMLVTCSAFVSHVIEIGRKVKLI